MIFIKLLLILIVSMSFIIFSFSSKLKSFKKVSIIAGYIIVVIFILFPSYANSVAHLFSIESGIDLIFYIVLALIVLVNVILYVGHNNSMRMITKIVRENAKKNAKKC